MKRKLLPLLLPLLLASCSSSPYGDYEFRLGQTNGSHLGIKATLLDEQYKDKEGSKTIKINADLGDDFSLAEMLSSYAEEYPILKELIDAIVDSVGEIKEIDGYFTWTDYESSKGRRLNLGLDVLSDIMGEDAGIDLSDYDLPPNLTEKFISAYLNETTLTFSVPVSMPDIQHQLIWYGYYLDFKNPINMVKVLDTSILPGLEGEARIGTHPTVTKENKEVILDEVAKVNEALAFTFSYTGLYDESYLSLGSFVLKGEGEERALYYQNEKETADASFSGKVQTKPEKGTSYSEYKDISFSIDKDNKTNVVFSEDGSSFTDSNGTVFTVEEMMQNPFVFRDFHTVEVGLRKA